MNLELEPHYEEWLHRKTMAIVDGQLEVDGYRVPADLVLSGAFSRFFPRWLAARNAGAR